jgi:phage baseplate assembly protein V
MSAARLGEVERRQDNHVKFGQVVAADYPNARLRVTLGDNQTAWLPWVAVRAGGNKSWRAPEVGESVIVISNGDLECGFVLPGVFSTANPANGNSADIARDDYKDGAFVQYDRAQHILTADLSAVSGSPQVNVNAGTNGTCTTTTGNTTTVQKQNDVKITVGANVSIEATNSQITFTVGNTSIQLSASGITLTAAGSNTVQLVAGGTSANQEVTISSGNLTVTEGAGSFGGDVTIEAAGAAITLAAHTHSAVTSGEETSGPPTPGT